MNLIMINSRAVLAAPAFTDGDLDLERTKFYSTVPGSGFTLCPDADITDDLDLTDAQWDDVRDAIYQDLQF